MKPRHLLIAFLLCLVECGYLSPQSRKTQTITAEQAKDHVGETDKVCGLVASTHYAYNTRGHPTFLNFGKPYPRVAQILIFDICDQRS